ncbi:polysaccharide pyruvyl transferase family protein [Priestia megaterium]|uniref:polysaccharide pyruvyl transferase family protein n=1 Tax=Priestia megaterium TaxID=1404 RepID=UPI003EEC9DEE
MIKNKEHPMEKLKKQLLCILDVIPPRSKIYYLDYPFHTNIGDLLIHKGSEKFFETNNIKVEARYSIFNFPQNLLIPKDHIIVLQGGGNFGDLWIKHQYFREMIINQYPEHRIVMLPQTVYFQNDDNYIKAKELFNKHSDLHIYARDIRSLGQLNGFCENVYLLPDMAHELWPINPRKTPCKENLYLLRNDKELNKKMIFKPQKNQDIADWSNLVTEKDAQRAREIKRGYKKVGISEADTWYEFSDYLIDKAVSLFSNYNKIITTRLHGHILACLLDKESTLYDNSYGKNSEYYHAWTYNLKNTNFIN